MTTPLKIELIVDDKGTLKVRQFGSEVDRVGKRGKDSFERTGKAVHTMNKRMETAHARIMKVAGAVVGIGALYLAFRKLNDVVKDSVKAASDLEEVASKFNVVFAGQVPLAEKWSKTLVDSYAMSTRESKQYLSSVQDLLVPMGMQANAAGKLSNEIVKLSADLGSFNNLPTAKVMDDIQSALVGNYETMKKYGVVLNATVVQERALAMGLADTKDALTAGQKAQAAYALMVEGSTAAIGDMARTSDSYANQVKQLEANIEDLKAMFGTKLLPVVTDIVKQMNLWVKENQALIDQKMDVYARNIGTALKTTVEFLGFLAEGVQNVSRMWLATEKAALSVEILTQKFKLWANEGEASEKKIRMELIATQQAYADVTAAILELDEAYAGVELPEVLVAVKKASEEVVKPLEDTIKATTDLGRETEIATWKIKEISSALRKEAQQAELYFTGIVGDEYLIYQMMQDIDRAVDQSVASYEAANDKVKAVTQDTTKYVETLWDHALNRVEIAFADTFYDAFKISLDGSLSILENFLNSIIRLLSEKLSATVMAELFGVATGAGSGPTGTGTGGGMGSIWDWLGIAKSGYEMYSGESLLGTLYNSLYGSQGSPSIYSGIGGMPAGLAGGYGGGGLGTAGSMAGSAGYGAGSTVGTLGPGTVGSTGAMGILGAVGAAVMAITAIFEHNMGNQGSSTFATKTRLGLSEDPDRLFTGEMYKAFASGGEWKDKDAKNAAERVAGIIADTLDMYNVLFENLSDTSKETLKLAVDQLDGLEFWVSVYAEEGAKVTGQIIRRTPDEISEAEWAGLAGQLKNKEIAEGVPLPTFNADMKAAMTAVLDEGGQITAELLAKIMGITLDQLESAFFTLYGDDLNNLVKNINDAYAKGWESLTGPEQTIPKAFQDVMGQYFEDYIEEALVNIKGQEVFSFMTDEIQTAIDGLTVDKFINDIDGFTKAFTDSVFQMQMAGKVWESLNAFVGRATDEVTAYEVASAKAQIQVGAYVQMLEAWGIELTEEEVLAKMNKVLKGFTDGIDDLDAAMKPLGQMGQMLAALNGQFDAYLTLLEKNGVDLAKITELEQMRYEATERLLSEYKVMIGLFGEDYAKNLRLDEITERYKELGLTHEGLIAAFKDMSLEQLKEMADALGIDWTDIADDVGFLMSVLKALGESAESAAATIIAAQRQLAGSTNQGTIDDIAKRYGMDPDVIDEDYAKKIRDKFLAMSPEEVEKWADALGVSVDQLIADIMALIGAAESAAATIIAAQRQLAGSTNQGTIDDIAKRYGMDPDVIDEDYAKKIRDKFLAMSPEEVEKWADALGVSVDQLIADIMALIGAFERASMSIEDAAARIKDIFQGVNDFIAGSGVVEKAARMWEMLLQLAIPYDAVPPPGETGKIPTPAELANMSEQLATWFYAAEAAARELGQAELETIRLEEQMVDRISSLIDQIDQTIRNIKYSALNVSLPRQKAAEAQEDYDKLLAAALTGGPEDVTKYLGFAQTYLGQQQADLKSSQAYQDVYASVMEDMETIRGMAESGGYDAKILEELQKGNQLTVEQTEAYKAAMIDVVAKWEHGMNWISKWVAKLEAAAVAISIDWPNFTGDMSDALKHLSDLVLIYGWDHEYALKFVAEIPMSLFEDLNDLATTAGWIADETGGWNSKATISFLKNVAANWEFKDIEQILASIGYVKTMAGSWVADATIAFIATLMDRHNIPIEDIDYWLDQMGIGDTEIQREVKINIIYSMFQSGDLDLEEIAKYAYNQAFAAWISEDSAFAIPILKMLEGLSKMWGVTSAHQMGVEVENLYPKGHEPQAWVDLWDYYGRAATWAEGGIVSSPTLGWVGEAGYPEAVIPMMDGYSIPVRWLNGGSTQMGANRGEEIALLRELVELQKEEIDTLRAKNMNPHVSVALDTGELVRQSGQYVSERSRRGTLDVRAIS